MAEISIIVPVYNAEKTLERCVESILKQSFTDYELILVDDGSSDHSLTICNKYACLDTRIKVIHQENWGVSVARNKGISVASGNYIMFCDSDDYVSEQWCEMLYSAIEKNVDSWVVSNAYKFNESGMYEISDEMNIRVFTGRGYEWIYKLGLSAFCWNKIYNMELLKNHNIVFDENCSLGEDVFFNIEYYKWCDKTIYIPTPLYYYCDNCEGLMHRYRRNLFEDNCRFFQARLPYISDEGMSSFCDQYLYYFIQWIENTWDAKNEDGFIKKMQYNNRLMKREEFRYCVSRASGAKESALYMRVVRLCNYYIYWIFMKITKLRQKCKNMD